jgi:ribosomal-protein-alanine N-acetyltransferase|tara:strand:- start:397 stop:921 length:525 start_codon:yes stop_codon:yes gene_type:complete
MKAQIRCMTIIKTREFILRPIRLTDAQGYLECHQDEDSKANFSSVPTTLEEAKKELQEGKKHNKKFAIIVKEKFAGFINLELTSHPRYKHSAIVGYGTHKNFRGMGLATKALKKITEYGFKELKLKRISGMCRTFNKASARVLEKAGYKHEGTLHKNKFSNGKYLDDMIWAKWK